MALWMDRSISKPTNVNGLLDWDTIKSMIVSRMLRSKEPKIAITIPLLENAKDLWLILSVNFAWRMDRTFSNLKQPLLSVSRLKSWLLMHTTQNSWDCMTNWLVWSLCLRAIVKNESVILHWNCRKKGTRRFSINFSSVWTTNNMVLSELIYFLNCLWMILTVLINPSSKKNSTGPLLVDAWITKVFKLSMFNPNVEREDWAWG